MKTTILPLVVSRFSILFVITLPDVHFRMKGVIIKAGSSDQPGKGFSSCCYVQLNGITTYIPSTLFFNIYSLSVDKEMNSLIDMNSQSLKHTNLNHDQDCFLVSHSLRSYTIVVSDCLVSLCHY